METRTILLVDDDPSIRRLIAHVLQASGFSVLTASGPRAALSAFEKRQCIDLLIAESLIPGMSGLELYTQLRRHDPALRVLFISAFASSLPIRNGVLERGFVLLPKPFTMSQLMTTVLSILAQPCASSATVA